MSRTFEIFQNTIEVDNVTPDVIAEADATAQFLVKKIHVRNHLGTNQNLKLWRIPGVAGNPGTNTDSNRFYNRTIIAGESKIIDLGLMIFPNDGDSIKALANIANGITISVDGGKDTTASSFARLLGATVVPNVVAPMLIQGASGKSIVKFMHIHNRTAAAVNLKLHRVPNNGGAVGTAADANGFFDRNIDADDYEIIPLDPMGFDTQNDTLQAVAGSVDALNMWIDGAVE